MQSCIRRGSALISAAALVTASVFVQTGTAAAEEAYTVQPGDTLSSIAVRYGTTIGAIASLNNIANPDLIQAGQVLRISGSGGTILTVSQTAPSGSVQERFAAGYRAAGGSEHLLQHILQRVIPCESNYDLYAYNAAGPFYGLMQFLPSTWRAAGGGDWYDAWQQGANTARLLLHATGASQWPVCWHR